MDKKLQYAPNNMTELPLKHYRDEFRAADPAEMSERTGVPYTDKGFCLNILGQERYADWPEFTGEGWTDKERILFMRYLLTAKKVDPCDSFLAYSEMPWGEVYDRNFRGRCVMPLIGRYGNQPDKLRELCGKLGGRVIPGSGLICEVEYMPNLKIRLIIWEGDDEFPASGQILFSGNFPDAFAAEDRVIVCENLLSVMKRL